MTQRAAAHHLVDLLTRVDRPYRPRWEAESLRPRDQLDRTAVLRVIAAHEVAAELIDLQEERDRPRRRKDWAARVFRGERVRQVDLALVCDSFDMCAEDRSTLLARLHAAADRPPPLLDVVELHEEHVIGPDRLPVRHRTEQTITAGDSPTTEHAFRFDTREVDVVVLSGGTPGQLVPDPIPGFWRLPITLDTPLAAGERTTLVYETRFAYSAPPLPEFRRSPRPGVPIRLTVHFDPAALPRLVELCTWRRGREGRDMSSPEPLTGTSVTRDVTADSGLVGFRWEW